MTRPEARKPPTPVVELRGVKTGMVEEAHLALADGFTFSDGSSERDLTVPSTFFRVILNGEEGEEDDSGSLVLEGG